MSDLYIVSSMFTTTGLIICAMELSYLFGRVRGYVLSGRRK